MISRESNSVLEDLSDLLERERTAVTCGHWKTIAALADEKDRLIGKLDRDASAEPARLAGLRRKLDRNKLLLQSAAEGIRTVSSRIEEFRKVQSGLHVYDESGKMRRFRSCQSASLRKKA